MCIILFIAPDNHWFSDYLWFNSTAIGMEIKFPKELQYLYQQQENNYRLFTALIQENIAPEW